MSMKVNDYLKILLINIIPSTIQLNNKFYWIQIYGFSDPKLWK